jgi:nucleoside-diphosphate-sugar epimerase
MLSLTFPTSQEGTILRVLVTGGAGFIGSHLAERHLELQDCVTVVDDLSTGSLENIRHLTSRGGFAYHIETVTNRSLMTELIESSDLVYHLAAAVGVRLVVEDPIRTIETNILGTELILNLAAARRKRVLLASSSEVYGKQDRVPLCEDDDMVFGATSVRRWSYACSKAIEEFLALAYWKDRRVPTVIARLFNAAGPRQTSRYGMVLPTLVGQALSEKDITVFGDGSQRRCFTHVSDIVEALIKLAAHPDANGEVYNVGSGHEVTILELAHRIKYLTGSGSQIAVIPYEKAYGAGFEDVVRRVPDLTKLNRLIDYRPQYSLDQTILDIIRDQKAQVLKAQIKTRVRGDPMPSASPIALTPVS